MVDRLEVLPEYAAAYQALVCRQETKDAGPAYTYNDIRDLDIMARARTANARAALTGRTAGRTRTPLLDRLTTIHGTEGAL